MDRLLGLSRGGGSWLGFGSSFDTAAQPEMVVEWRLIWAMVGGDEGKLLVSFFLLEFLLHWNFPDVHSL